MTEQKDAWKSIPGWLYSQNAAALERLMIENDVKTVLEIGSFLGKSTTFFAARCEKVISIDPFTIWPEGTQNGDALRWSGGGIFRDKFERNLIEAGLLEKVSVWPMTSEEAFNVAEGLTADMIYIDGEHDKESVMKDIGLWFPRAKKIICGDDHNENWKGVVEAVKESFGEDYKLDNDVWFKIK